MIEVELILCFVMIILDLLFVVVGGWLLPLVGACFSFTFAGLMLADSASFVYSPYPQFLLIMVGLVCAVVAAVKYKGVAD